MSFVFSHSFSVPAFCLFSLLTCSSVSRVRSKELFGLLPTALMSFLYESLTVDVFHFSCLISSYLLQSHFSTTALLRIFPFQPAVLALWASDTERICQQLWILLESSAHVFFPEILFLAHWDPHSFLLSIYSTLPSPQLSPSFSPEFSACSISHALVLHRSSFHTSYVLMAAFSLLSHLLSFLSLFLLSLLCSFRASIYKSLGT